MTERPVPWRAALSYPGHAHVVSLLECAALDSIRQWGDAVLCGKSPQYFLSWDRNADHPGIAPFWTSEPRWIRRLEARGLVVMVDDYGRAMAV